MSVIKDHHIYEAIWTLKIAKELSVQFEDDNKHDEHAIAVIKDDLL